MVKLAEERTIKARYEDEIAESIKVTMKALKEFFGLKSGSVRNRLRAVGAEFGHIVARNITDTTDPSVLLEELSLFWNSHGLGEMSLLAEEPFTFTVQNCYDCLAAQQGETLCGFKEGFINAVVSDRTGGMGTVDEIECCGTGTAYCKFRVTPFQREPTTVKIET